MQSAAHAGGAPGEMSNASVAGGRKCGEQLEVAMMARITLKGITRAESNSNNQ